MREAEGGDEHTATLYALAIAFGNVGEHQHMVDLLQEVLEKYEKDYGPDHPSLVFFLNSLGNADIKLGNFERGRIVLERADNGQSPPPIEATGRTADGKNTCSLSSKHNLFFFFFFFKYIFFPKSKNKT